MNIPSSDYEAEANQLRAEIGGKIVALRSRLTPRAIASEAAANVGVADLSWRDAFEYASRRHPGPAVVIGIGIALLMISAARQGATRRNVAALTSPLRETTASLVDSATSVLRAQAESKRREFVATAQTQVGSAAAMVSDEVEKNLEKFLERVPGGASVRPMIESSLQVALAALLEGLLDGRTRR
jgi:hypothetical protein